MGWDAILCDYYEVMRVHRGEWLDMFNSDISYKTRWYDCASLLFDWLDPFRPCIHRNGHQMFFWFTLIKLYGFIIWVPGHWFRCYIKWFVVSFLNSIAKLCCWYYSSRPVVRSICSCYYDIWTSIMHLSIISELTCNTICIICSIHIQILFCIFLELKRMSYFWKVHIWAAVIIFKVNLKIFHFWTFMFITNILKIILFVFKVTINSHFSLVLVRKRYSECKMNEYAHTHTHTHTRTLVFLSLWVHSIGVMFFLLYKLYFLSP